MVGTRNIKDLPALLEEVMRRRLLSVGARRAVPLQIANIRQDGISIEYTDQIKRHGQFHAWLPIMTGCNKACTFCIVPKTRGCEVSMPVHEVCREAERLAGEGVKWITLLGQNVNSYQGNLEKFEVRSSKFKEVASRNLPLPTSNSQRSPATAFPELLDRLCQIPGLERISFTTSHPQDATKELFETIARNPKISRRFHLPLQSGSDKILKRMKRLHTFAEYKEKVELLRKLVPEISMTTDIIAGFSGESEEDHEATLAALAEIRFDDAYIYKYSVRAGTPAAKLKDDVPPAVKERRNGELLGLQRKISRENHEKFLGKAVEVFAEQRSPKDKAMLRGRASDERKIVFAGGQELLGTFQSVIIEKLKHETFLGKLTVKNARC
jgi:tRNA-2-methylthio-N6-dimethylallyladenosine synthase